MNALEFQALLDRVGSDLNDWPAEQRSAAEELLARDATARDALGRARRLDLLLADALNEVDAAAERDLIQRTLDAIDGEPPRLIYRVFAWLWPERRAIRWARTALACVVPLAVGFALGISSSNDGTSELVQLSQSAFMTSVAESTTP